MADLALDHRSAPVQAAEDMGRAPAGSLVIVHVVRQFWPGVGGLENYVAVLARHQAALGHRVRVVTLDRIFHGDQGPLPKVEQHDGYEIRRIPYRGSQRYPFAPRVLGAIDDAQLVHVHAIDFFADFLAATWIWHRKPMVISTHGGFFHTSFAKSLKQIYFHTVTRCSLAAYHTVIPSSEQDSAYFASIRRAGMETVECGVEVDKFAGLADPAARVMLYFGRIAPNKECPRLIRWFAAFHRAAPEWKLIIAGKATGVAWETLEALADEHKVADSVEFHDTPDDAALADLIARAGVYVCASSYEGFGIAAVEAASSGLFPVLSNIVPFERTVGQTGLGMVVDFDAAPDVERLLANFADHGRQASRQRMASAVAPLGWAAKHLQILEIYEKALRAGKRPVSEAIA